MGGAATPMGGAGPPALELRPTREGEGSGPLGCDFFHFSEFTGRVRLGQTVQVQVRTDLVGFAEFCWADRVLSGLVLVESAGRVRCRT